MSRLKKLIKEALTIPPKKNCDCGGACCSTEITAPILKDNKFVYTSISEGLQYHIDNKIPLSNNIYRVGTKEYMELYKEARSLYSRNRLNVSEEDKYILTETNIGDFGIFEGKKVPLGIPMLNEGDEADEIAQAEFGLDYDQLGPKEQEWVRDEYENQHTFWRSSIKENIDIYDFLKKNREQILLDFGPLTYRTLQVQLMKGDEAWVRSWLVNKGYMDEEKLPFEEGKLNEDKRRQIQFKYVGSNARIKALLKNLKKGRDYDFGVGQGGLVLLDIDVRYLDQLVSILNKSRIPYKMVEGKLNESVIGVKTDRSFKPATLTKALDKAKIKYKFNRLSMTLSVLNLDKKYFETAKKIVDALGLNVMMATEVKIKTINEGKVYYEAGEKWVVYNTKTGKRIPNAGKFWTRSKDAKIFADKQKNAKVASDTWYMDTIYDEKEPTKSKFKKAGEKSGFDMRGLKESPMSEKQKLNEDEATDEELKREYDNILSREADLTRIYQNYRTEENWERLSIFRHKGRNLEKKLAKMGLIDSYLAEIIESKPQQSDSKAYYIYIKEGNKIKQWRVENILNEDFKKGDKVKYIGKKTIRTKLDPKKVYNVQDVVQDGEGGLTIVVNQYPVKAKDLKLAEDKVNFSKKEMTKLHKDGTIKKGGNKYTFTNEGKVYYEANMNSEILDVVEDLQTLIKKLKRDSDYKERPEVEKLFSYAGPIVKELHKLVEGKVNEAKDYVYSKSSQIPFVKRLLQSLQMGMGTKPLSDYQISVIIDALYRHKIIH